LPIDRHTSPKPVRYWGKITFGYLEKSSSKILFRLMLVDDEPIILEKLTHIINAVATDCCNVATALNGTKAMHPARMMQPQIIFSDIHMPLMNGIELAQALKQILPESLIVLINGYNEFSYA